MRLSVSALLVMVVAGCRGVSPGDAPCTTDNNCPAPYVCGALGFCVETAAPDGRQSDGGSACPAVASAFAGLSTEANACDITLPTFTAAEVTQCESSCTSSTDQSALAALASCLAAVAACDPSNAAPFVAAVNGCAADEGNLTGGCEALIPSNTDPRDSE